MVYGEAKRILHAYENKEGSIQSLINKSMCQVRLASVKIQFGFYKYNHCVMSFFFNKHKNSLTCMIMKNLCYQKLLNKLIKRSSLLERETYLGEKLAQLLVYDVLFGIGVRGKFKVWRKTNKIRCCVLELFIHLL